MHRLSDAEILAAPTTFRRLVRYVYDVPWPVTSREAVLHCVGFPLLESRAALLTARSLYESSFLGFPIPLPDQHVVRCDVSVACAKVTVLEAELTHMMVAGHVDIRLVSLISALFAHCSDQFLRETRSLLLHADYEETAGWLPGQSV